MGAPDSIKLAIAQMNPTVGDLPGNATRIIAFYDKALKDGADIVVCPELALTGYPPEDLILMKDFRAQAMHMLKQLASKTKGKAALLVGSVWEENGHVYNAAVLMDNGSILSIQPKIALPNYGIFDEKRLFTPGSKPVVCDWRGIKLGMLICEDIWHPQLAQGLAQDGAELLIVINASPFEAGKLQQRRQVTAEAVKQANIPLVYVNAVGGQDDIVFDGGSFVVSADGTPARLVEQFTEALEVVPLQKQDNRWQIASAKIAAPVGLEESLWQAMMMGLADYLSKNDFSTVVLGLSGGIDSALTAALAVDALGPEAVKGVLLPSPFTSQESIEDALLTADMLGIETMTVPIASGMDVVNDVLTPIFNKPKWMENIGIGGNVQARLRGLMLMAISNRFGWMLLNTGNKSEVAVGYTTLYGDSCGSYSLLKDVYKTQVYQLSRWRNQFGEVIPQRSIDKAPSAELAPGQKDQDQLPPYEILDRILAMHLEGRLSAQEIAAEGLPGDVVDRVLKMVRVSEYKRRQSCPGVKLSSMLFGKDRRYPLTNKF